MNEKKYYLLTVEETGLMCKSEIRNHVCIGDPVNAFIRLTWNDLRTSNHTVFLSSREISEAQYHAMPKHMKRLKT